MSSRRLNALSRAFRPAAMAMALGVALGPPCWAASGVGVRNEAQVKAAFVLQFARFVQWPPSPRGAAQGSLALCMMADNGLEGALDALAGSTVRDRTLVVQRVTPHADLRACHILVVDETVEARLPEILHAIEGAPVLTVGELDGFARDGGMISLLVADERVQFEINLDAAQHGDLNISAQLLRLARAVWKTKRP